MTTLIPSAANVLRAFRDASPEDIETGRSWYASAHAIASELDPEDPERASAVLAVLSPLTPWQTNVSLARSVYAMYRNGMSTDDIVRLLPTLKRHARKAAAIVAGAEPASIVSGPKVIPFWHRIAYAANGDTGPGSVVIDRHAFDAAVGRVTSDTERGRFLGRKGGHARVAQCYLRAASVLRRTGEAPDLTPSELQAIVWSVWRRVHAHPMGKAEHRRDVAARVTLARAEVSR